MTAIRIQSVEEPFDTPTTVRSAVSFLSRAETMGFLGSENVDHLSIEAVRRVIDEMTRAGLGSAPGALLHVPESEIDERDIVGVLAELEDILESSPAPEREWPVLTDLFGIETLAGLLAVSPASVRRYQRGDRMTPDRVAARLHYLAMVVSDLSGAYNNFGIRRWFGRARSGLDGAAPQTLLTGNWDPDQPGPRRVRVLARALLGSPAT